MKKLLITMTATMVCVGAFGQGKLAFNQDANHRVYFTTDTAILNPSDSSLAGRGVYQTTIALLGGASLVADLWAGASATTLAKVTTVSTWSAVVSGNWTAANATFATLPGGTPAFFQIQIHDSRAASALEAWAQTGWYAGESPVFTAVPQPSSFSPIYSALTPVFSTWAPGTQQLSDAAAGNFGAIAVYATIPEPGTFALAGLGLASLLIFRRRK